MATSSQKLAKSIEQKPEQTAFGKLTQEEQSQKGAVSYLN